MRIFQDLRTSDQSSGIKYLKDLYLYFTIRTRENKMNLEKKSPFFTTKSFYCQVLSFRPCKPGGLLLHELSPCQTERETYAHVLRTWSYYLEPRFISMDLMRQIILVLNYHHKRGNSIAAL